MLSQAGRMLPSLQKLSSNYLPERLSADGVKVSKFSSETSSRQWMNKSDKQPLDKMHMNEVLVSVFYCGVSKHVDCSWRITNTTPASIFLYSFSFLQALVCFLHNFIT